MGDDSSRVAAVLEVLLPLLQDHPLLQVGDPAELRMRGPGRRVVFEVTRAAVPSAEYRVERDDQPPGTRGELPPRRH
ncbi:hypothetical protein ACFYWP_36890 [Actinacidiphila glaucinigra]|uniref:hypothetical protein n=1 Tax=Actinacidiphila glaucinigra TaxID=235986 RepID=UPI0036B0C9AC